ncbi:MAG: InlB B-repeat-containing protein [Treponema sp.]|nr:InlB B-repeat-containing protein [Treponema sp.]
MKTKLAFLLAAAIAIMGASCKMEAPEGVVSFTVIFDTDGGDPETIAPVTVVEGETLGDKFPEEPAKEGYIFKGWFSLLTEYTATTKIDNDVYLTAKWEKKGEIVYAVTFNTDGGSPSGIGSLKVNAGQSLANRLPSPPTKTNYIFGGWFDADNNEYTATTAINSDVALKAKWNPKGDIVYTITFDSREGSAVANLVVNENTGMGANFPTPSRPGFRFGGWSDSNGKRFTAETEITANIALAAVWIRVWTVTFDANGGSPNTINPIQLDDGESMGGLYPQPTKNDFYLVGWFDGETEYAIDTPIQNNLALKAKWMPIPFTVIFDSDGGDDVDYIIIEIHNGMGDQYPSPRKEFFNFGGWFDADNNEYTAETPILSDLVLKARWIPIPFTVTFNKNNDDKTGATEAIPGSITTTTQTVGTLPTAPTRSAAWGAGMVFDGWYNSESGGTAFTETTRVTANIEVFARWKFVAGTPRTIGNTLVVIAPATTSNSADNPSNQGTWNGTTNADGSVSWTSGAARFEFPLGYADYDFLDLEYVATGLIADTVLKQSTTSEDYFRREANAYAHPYGDSGTLSFNLKTASGVQTGVSLQIHGEDAGDNSSIKWTRATFTKGTRYTVTFNSATYSGWSKPANIAAVANVAMGPLPVRERANYNFTGWYDETTTPEATLYTSSSIMPAKNLNLTAHWRPVVAGIDQIKVAFSNANLTVRGGGDISITGGGTGYDWKRSGEGHEYSFVRIAVTLAANATLADYDTISFTLEQYDNGINGDNQNYKPLGVLARASFEGVTSLSLTGNDAPPYLTGGDATAYLIAPSTQYSSGSKDQTFTINKEGVAKNLSGSIELIIYTHSPTNTGMRVSNLVIGLTR